MAFIVVFVGMTFPSSFTFCRLESAFSMSSIFQENGLHKRFPAFNNGWSILKNYSKYKHLQLTSTWCTVDPCTIDLRNDRLIIVCVLHVTAVYFKMLIYQHILICHYTFATNSMCAIIQLYNIIIFNANIMFIIYLKSTLTLNLYATKILIYYKYTNYNSNIISPFIILNRIVIKTQN